MTFNEWLMFIKHISIDKFNELPCEKQVILELDYETEYGGIPNER